MIGLAVVLIVGGALASAWLALQAGNRADFLRIDRSVAQGSRITADDLGHVSLPEGYDGGIPADQADSVVGKSASVRLLPGTVLSPAMVSQKGGIAEHESQLTLPVDSSPFIRGLQPGAQLALDVGDENSGGRKAILAQLVSVGQPDGSGGGLTGSGSSDTLQIVVSVDVSCLSDVSQGIQDKSITPALLGGANHGLVMARCGG